MVGGAPDLLGGFMLGGELVRIVWEVWGRGDQYVVGQCLPVGAVNQRDDASRCFWRAAVVLAGGVSVGFCGVV